MRILSHGYLAVDLFFALSGFVLAMNYSGKLSREFTLQAYLSFLARRFARIYPLYLFTLTAATALVASHLMELHANPSRIFLPNLFMVQNWGPWASINPPAWSLSTEVFAYLLFPFLLMLTASRGSICAFSVCATSIGALATISLLSGGQLGVFSGPLSLLRCVAEFNLGLLAYRMAISEFGSWMKHYSFLTTALAGVLLLLLALPLTDLPIALIFPLFIMALHGQATWINRLLGSGPVELLGILSFSVYLLHWLFNPILEMLSLYFLGKGFPHAHSVAVGIVIPAVLATSFATYHLIEDPGRRILRRVLEPAPERVIAGR